MFAPWVRRAVVTAYAWIFRSLSGILEAKRGRLSERLAQSAMSRTVHKDLPSISNFIAVMVRHFDNSGYSQAMDIGDLCQAVIEGHSLSREQTSRVSKGKPVVENRCYRIISDLATQGYAKRVEGGWMMDAVKARLIMDGQVVVHGGRIEIRP